MKKRMRISTGLLLFFCFGGYFSGGHVQISEQKEIDRFSYNLGVIGAFSEVVSLGIKKLALSAAMSPEEMKVVLPEAERIAKENGVSIWLERDFLVTDLFPEQYTTGKQVLLIYLDPVKEEYTALKAKKAELVNQGLYMGEARSKIAFEMGRLLSYPEDRIEKLLAQNRKEPE